MFLHSFGCSFIFGSDLGDERRWGDLRAPSRRTWPALLAQQLELEYNCMAKGGAGNLQILDRVLTSIAERPGQRNFYVIGWTWIDRFDYSDPTGRHHGSNNTVNNDWCTLLPNDDSDVAEHYYRNLHSEFRDCYTTLMCINTAVTVLKERNLPFIMTAMDDLIFRDENSSTLRLLQDQIRDHITDFQGKNFLAWSRDRGFPISDTLHPLEEAHAAAVPLMLDLARSRLA